MIEPPSIAETRAQITAVLHLTIPRERIGQEMPPAIDELMAAVAGRGLRVAGPLFTRHLTTSPDVFDLEVGFPVGVPVPCSGRVRPGVLPATEVVRTIYHGGYDGLYQAWEAFGSRTQAELGEILAQERLEPAETLWESYLVGPESDPDPAVWQTELNQPLRRMLP